jgi:hypothetical protein
MEKGLSALLIGPRKLMKHLREHLAFFIIALSVSEQCASSLYWKRCLLSE